MSGLLLKVNNIVQEERFYMIPISRKLSCAQLLHSPYIESVLPKLYILAKSIYRTDDFIKYKTLYPSLKSNPPTGPSSFISCSASSLSLFWILTFEVQSMKVPPQLVSSQNIKLFCLLTSFLFSNARAELQLCEVSWDT